MRFKHILCANREGGYIELNTQQEVQQAIRSELYQSRYHLVEEAPICQDDLRGQFGYNASTLAARQVVAGTYQFGEEFHKGIKCICEAIADIRRVKKKEDTSSLASKLHFGHYTSGAYSDKISDFYALKTSLAIVHGIALKRWSRSM
ncbi:LOW QUALITY PROTEIN: hypothetical protein ACHAWX_004946 [Stephanocyclus meneghinianus]